MKTVFAIGTSEIGRPVELCRTARSMHTQIIGATGVGKTESAILPMILSDIIEKQAVIFIDPKGDQKTAKTLEHICALTGRTADFVKLNLSQPGASTSYNPLKIGSPSELKDKIIGSTIWTEEFYKKIAERVLLDIFNYLRTTQQAPTLAKVYQLLTGEKPKDVTDEDALKEKVEFEGLDQNTKTNIEGLKTDLALWVNSDIGEILTRPDSSSVLDWIMGRKIVYINLSTLAFEETSRRFGRLILQDLKSAFQAIQALPDVERVPANVYVDEFASVASSGFIELLSKARSSNVAITVAYQSLGDLQAVSPFFPGQVLDNTTNKFIFRVDSPDTSDFFARLIGTRAAKKITHQTQNHLLTGPRHTGVGTLTEVEEFMVSPNELRRLSRGECVLLSKEPFQVSKVKLKQISKSIKQFQNRNRTWREKCRFLWSVS